MLGAEAEYQQSSSEEKGMEYPSLSGRTFKDLNFLPYVIQSINLSINQLIQLTYW